LRSRIKEDEEKSGRRGLGIGRGGKARKVKKYYNRQNALIDAYLGSNEEEAAEVADQIELFLFLIVSRSLRQ